MVVGRKSAKRKEYILGCVERGMGKAMLEILAPVREELFAQEALVQRALDVAGGCPPKEHVSAAATVDAEWHNPQKYIRPALVLLTSRLYQHRPDVAVPLAAVHQFIYLAGRVHTGVAEESALRRKNAREAYQFPVLVGDYLYGRFFTTLCDAGQDHLLGDLARVISAMNEGGMMRARNAQGQADYDILEIIRLETAELLASCCRLGGVAGGASGPETGHLYNLGLELGLAFGRLEEGHSFPDAAGHLQRALNELSLLFCRRTSDQLERFIRLFLACGYPPEGWVLDAAGGLAG
ncbi:MAG TPA: polyprenyl synthetase family protein [Spirochaetia bacterium]|nr:polyprenyl synthetase family protein [Spirochaetia bacterium]